MKYSFLLFFVLVGADQLSKMLAFNAGWGYVNVGISFGLLDFLPVWVLTVCIASCIVAVLWSCREFWQKQQLVAALFFAGAVSNTLDRLLWGGVWDWLPVPFFELKNNLADWYIAISVVYFIGSELRKKYA